VTPATYTVNVESPGFKRLERPGVLVSTQAAVTVDLRLELGAVDQQVNVTAEAPPLQTGDASTGQLIDSQKITDLPVLGTQPVLHVGKLAQAVVFVANPKFARMQDQNGNSQVSIAGGPLRTNNYLVDGISITDSNNRAVIVPSPEAVQELKVQASTYDAEVGPHRRRHLQHIAALRHATTSTAAPSATSAKPIGWPTASSPTAPATRSPTNRFAIGPDRSVARS
jgi:hypothetical protein